MYDDNGPAEAEVTDEYGVLHRIWRVSDPATILLLTTAMADKKLIIADGHHRYETALNYSKEHAPASSAAPEHSTTQLPQPPYPEAAVMMTFVNMDSDGLVILPTHRVVHSLENFDPAAFLRAAERVLHRRALAEADAQSYMKTLGASTALPLSPSRRPALTCCALKPRPWTPRSPTCPSASASLT